MEKIHLQDLLKIPKKTYVKLKDDLKFYRKFDNDLKFIDKFFGITPTPTQKDFIQFEKFKKAFALKFQENKTISQISRVLGVDRKTLCLWFKFKQLPFIVQMLLCYKKLGRPRHCWRWLTINIGFGQTLKGPWLKVPLEIVSI